MQGFVRSGLRGFRRLAAGCAAPLLLLAAAPLGAADALTAVLMAPLSPPVVPVLGADGARHYVYELVLTNVGQQPASLERVEVLGDGPSASTLAKFEDDGLVSRLRNPARLPLNGLSIEPAATRILLVDFALPAAAEVPVRVRHRIAGRAAAVGNDLTPFDWTGVPVAVQAQIDTLGPPLAGSHWVAFNGCCAANGVHRATEMWVNGSLHHAQRFAIDWMQLDAEGRLHRGDGSRVEDFAFYASPVLAVADGTVVDVLDELDDQVPGSLPDPKTINLQNVGGNHIVLDLGGGRFGFYAHLKKGSMRVAKGDRVRRGQVLALLGNSGNTSAPHLHFHLMDSPSPLGSSGLPYLLDRFALAGQLSAERFDKGGLDGSWSEFLLPEPAPRSGEFPLNLTVVNFAD